MNINNEHNLQSTGAVKPIYSITPFTLLDYPDKTACILWFAGCNMRCVYCYNPDIVFGKGKLSFNEALKFLNARKNLLDGVVLSGGECTLHKNIISLIKEIKSLGLLVKIDTNGSKPKVLEQLIKENYIDYVALDFKATKDKFKKITESDLYSNFITSLKLLIDKKIPFEIRTTIHSLLLDQADLNEMIRVLKSCNYTGTYYLQNYLDNTKTIGNIQNSNKRNFDIAQLNSEINVVLRN